MILNLSDEQIAIIVTALRCTAHVSREAKHNEQANQFGELAQTIDDQRWEYLDREAAKEKRDSL